MSSDASTEECTECTIPVGGGVGSICSSSRDCMKVVKLGEEVNKSTYMDMDMGGGRMRVMKLILWTIDKQ